MSYIRLPWKWLPIYALTCVILPGILAYGAFGWSVEAGLITGVFGAVFGALGWLLLGVRIPSPYASLAEAYGKQLEQLVRACELGLGWKSRAQDARALLQRARPYVGSAPLEGSLTLEQDIEAFLYREEEEENE